MASTVSLSINTAVTVFIEETEVLPGTIIATSSQQITVMIPGDILGDINVKGLKARIRAINQKGCHDFTGTITAQSISPPALTVTISDVKTVQRRRYFRWPVSTEATIEVGEPLERHDGKLKDLSANGAGVMTNAPLQIGDVIMLRFHLPEGEVSVRARVVRVEFLGEPLWRRLAGIEFIEISDKDRDKVVRHIFNEQANARRLGLL